MFFQKILKYNYKVLLIDIIYKANKYQMFLIIISKIILLNISYYLNPTFLLLVINYWGLYYKLLKDELLVTGEICCQSKKLYL